MTSIQQDTAVLDAVRLQYQEAEEEIRRAAEALRRLVSASDQLDVARGTLGEAYAAIREDGRRLLAGTEALGRAVESIDRATGELAKADPVRLADLVETTSSTLRQQVDGTTAAVRLHAERTEAWQQQVLVTLGQVSSQIRQDVRSELGPPLDAIRKGVEGMAGTSAREFTALGIAVEKAVSTSARDAAALRSVMDDAEVARSKEAGALLARQEVQSTALSNTLDSLAVRILARVEESATVSGRDLAGIQSALANAEEARRSELNNLQMRREAEKTALANDLDSLKRRLLLEVRLAGGLILISVGVVLGWVVLL
jgi:hypothetical protein